MSVCVKHIIALVHGGAAGQITVQSTQTRSCGPQFNRSNHGQKRLCQFAGFVDCQRHRFNFGFRIVKSVLNLHRDNALLDGDEICDTGKGVPQNYVEAVKWYRLAADQGDAAAQTSLGAKYQKGRGVPQSDAEALRWFRKAADQGDGGAQFNLGLMYLDGYGVPHSDAEAAGWFRKAADQGYADAQYNLGVMYHDGHGVPQRSDAEAVRWWRKAAEQGYALAQYNLGSMYHDGHGVPQDYVSAHMWLNLAAASGEQRAAQRRDAVARLMTPAQIAEAQKLEHEWKPTKQRPQ